MAHLLEENAFIIMQEAMVALRLEQVLVHHIVNARRSTVAQRLLTRLLIRFSMLILTHSRILILVLHFNGAIHCWIIVLDDALDLWVHLLLLLLVEGIIVTNMRVMVHFSQPHRINRHTFRPVCIIRHV